MKRRPISQSPLALAILFCMVAGPLGAGELELRVTDEATGEMIGARVQLMDARGRARRVPKVASFADHFSVYGPTVLPLTGEFRYLIQSGPERLERAGGFSLKRDATDNHALSLKRFVDMKSKGWWSGDPWASRKLRDAGLLLMAEDLHLLGMPSVLSAADGTSNRTTSEAVTAKNNRASDARGVAFSEPGGRVHFWGGSSTTGPVDDPSERRFALSRASDNESHIQLATTAAWDLPIWLATENLDSLLVHQPKIGPNKSSGLPAGRPADPVLFSDQHGEGRYHESIYHHILNTGLRIAPAASARSGVSREAPGTYRTYVQMEDEFSVDAWWQGLRAGRVMITNGPLIIATMNGEAPGHIFTADADASVSLEPKLTLFTKEKIDYLEIIVNGESAREVRLDEWVAAKGKLQPFEFEESGWLLIRAVTNHGETYRYASTAPFYVEIGNQPRISRKSCEYFLDWVMERAKHLKSTNDPNRGPLLPHLRHARDFWQARIETANAP